MSLTADQMRAYLVKTTLAAFPASIQDVLMADPSFRREYKITTDAMVSFKNVGSTFQRSSIFDAVRRAFRARRKKPTVEDHAGQKWTVEFKNDTTPAHMLLSNDQQHILNSHFAMLSPSKFVRLNVFRHEADRFGLPDDDRTKWENLLVTRAPEDDELGFIQDDLNATPIALRAIISESLADGGGLLQTIVPHSSTYYNRLIGNLGDAQDFETYVSGGLRQHIRALAAKDSSRGYRQSLLLAAQPAISVEIATSTSPSDRIATIWSELAQTGDVLSLTAAIETGLQYSQVYGELREPLVRLIEIAVAAAPVAQVDPFELLSSLIILAYGEIAYSRVLAAKPPYWRRLAAIAHAAMMARCVIEVGGDAKPIVDWAKSARVQVFMLQTFVDIREEPRWTAELILPQQLRNVLGGRILLASHAHTAIVEQLDMTELLLGVGPGSLSSQLNIPLSFLPGPLEGAFKAAIEMPDDHLADIRSNLLLPLPSAASFLSLANAALLFRIPDDVSDLAAEALARCGYYIQRADGEPLVLFLLGLAMVAATTRSDTLADALLTVLRNYRRAYTSELDVDTAFRVAMVACGSRTLLSDWCACVGACMTDMAFQELAADEAERLHSHVSILCHLVPELWATCGHAEAALSSFIAR